MAPLAHRPIPESPLHRRGVPAFCVLLLVAAACFGVSRTIRAGLPANPFATDGPGTTAESPASQPAVAHASGQAPRFDAAAYIPSGQHDVGASLEAAIRAALDGYDGSYSVVVRRLEDGAEASVNADRVYYSASLFKLAVLYETEFRLSRGQLDGTRPLPIGAADIAEDDGTFWMLPFAEDGTISIHDALDPMITISDTTTANAFLHLLGGNQVDHTLRLLGLKETSVSTRELPTTAADMARLMEALYLGKGLDRAEREHVRALLEAQTWRSGIPAGIPEGVVIGNKTGNVEGVTHDVAFVEAPGGTYIIAVLSDGSWDWRPVRAVSQAVFAVLGAPRLRE